MGEDFGNEFIFDFDLEADGKHAAIIYQYFLTGMKGQGFDIAAFEFCKCQDHLFHRIAGAIDDAKDILEIALKVHVLADLIALLQDLQIPDPVQSKYFEFVFFVQGKQVPALFEFF